MPYKVNDPVRAKSKLSFPSGNQVPKGEPGVVTGVTQLNTVLVLFRSLSHNESVQESDIEPVLPTAAGAPAQIRVVINRAIGSANIAAGCECTAVAVIVLTDNGVETRVPPDAIDWP